MAARRNREKESDGGTSLLEWISATVGALIAISLLGFIAVEALRTKDGTPPLLEVRPTAIVAWNGRYVVEVGVRNRSGQTAAAVEIQGELKRGGQPVETSNATLTFVPGGSERRAGLVFSRDPRAFEFDARATGYEVP